jgi:hypothetical protein
MNRIKRDISQLIHEDPLNALILADQLWEDSWFECRLLGIHILGMLPLDYSNHIVARLQLWGKNCQEDALLDALLDHGAAHIRESSPNEYQLLVEDWLSDGEQASRKVGLRALPALILHPTFDNLPVFYRLLAPLVRDSASMLETDLLGAVRALGQRSPQETAYFLHQNLIATKNKGIAVITRRSLDVFPPDLQNSLRKVLRERMRNQD